MEVVMVSKNKDLWWLTGGRFALMRQIRFQMTQLSNIRLFVIQVLVQKTLAAKYKKHLTA